MQRYFRAVTFLFLAVSSSFAVTNGQVAISSGTGFYTVDISSNASGNARQNIVIADPTQVTGLATVDPVTGLTVHLATSSLTNYGLNVYQTNPSTVTFPNAQPVTSTSTQINSSTIAVTNVSGTSLSVTDSNTGFNVNNAPTVVISTNGVSSSTVGVVNANGTQLTVVSTGIPIIPSTIAENVVSTYTTIVSTGIPVTSLTQLTVVSTGVPVTSLTPLTVVSTGIPSIVIQSTVGVVSPSGTQLTVVSTGLPVRVIQSTAGVVGTTSDNGAASATNRVGALAGIYQKAYLNNTAATQGRDAALSVLVDGSLQVWNAPDISTGSFVASTSPYSISIATQDLTAVCGNARTMVWVTGLSVDCTGTTASTTTITVAKRSANYVGAFSSITVAPEDSNYAVPGSTGIFITGINVTNGALVGYLDSQQITCAGAASTTSNDHYVSPVDWQSKPIILRGVSQCVAVNIQGSTATGIKFSTRWKWIETGTITP